MNTANAIYTAYENKVRDARRQFGNENMVVLYRVGDFDQILSIEDGLVDIHGLAELLKTIVCKFRRNDPIVSRDNFLMMGWPVGFNDRMVARLRAHGYVVVGIKEGDTHFEQYTTMYDIYESKVRDAKASLSPDAVVVYKVGLFYQIMSIEDGLVDLHRLASILNARIVKLNRQNPIVGRDNWLMIGWPEAFNDRMVARLRAHGYVVVGIKKGDTHFEQYPESMPGEEASVHGPTPPTMVTKYNKYTDYENKVRDARTRFGPTTQVVYRVGDFYQIMSIEDGLVDLHRLASILNARIVKLNRQNPIVGRDNWLMIGWPIPYNDRMVAKLRAHENHVVMV